MNRDEIFKRDPISGNFQIAANVICPPMMATFLKRITRKYSAEASQKVSQALDKKHGFSVASDRRAFVTTTTSPNEPDPD